MIIDFTKDDTYQHQIYVGVGFALNWSGSVSAVVPVTGFPHQEEIIVWPMVETDKISFIDTDDIITFGG